MPRRSSASATRQELAAIRDELAVQLADMTRLHALASAPLQQPGTHAVLEEVLAAVTGLQGTDRGVLMLHDRERDVMTTAASVGFTAEQLGVAERSGRRARHRRAITAVISGGIVVEDVQADPVLAPHLPAARRAGCHAVCSTPLLTCGGRAGRGDRHLLPRPHRPSERETRLVELYARQAAEFIDNARLYREIREADRRKGEFLAMLGHELRNPLAPVLNALHVLRSAGASPADEAEQVAGHRRATGPAPGPAGRRPARRLADQQRQDPAPQGPRRPARRRSPAPWRPPGR